MTRSIFKLIKEYPGSPKLGTIIYSNDSDSMNKYHPIEWYEYWEKVKEFKSTIKTLDEKELSLGDLCFHIDIWGNIHSIPVHDLSLFDVYSSQEKTIKARDNQISLQIENELIKGENIPLFGVLPKTEWQVIETTSCTLYFKTIKQGKGSVWKYFRTERERDDYIYNNKPIFSRNDLKNGNNS